MIKNEKQYLTTKKQIKHFQKAIEQSKKSEGKIDPILYKAMINGIRSQIADLEEEVAEYEKLKKKEEDIIIKDLQDIPIALIKVRIAKGFSQEKLAELTHMKQQQLQRYEANDYQGVGFEKLVQIGKALGVKFHSNIRVDVE